MSGIDVRCSNDEVSDMKDLISRNGRISKSAVTWLIGRTRDPGLSFLEMRFDE